MKKKQRRSYTPEQKAAILKRHLVDKVPVSDVCEENKIQPSVFYEWQRQLLENMPVALEKRSNKPEPRETALQHEVDALKARLAKKDSVIAEISQEYVALKKELGEP